MNANVEILDIYEYDNKNNNKSGKVKILLLLLILILIVLIGIGLYVFLKYAKEQTNKIKVEDKVVELGSKIDNQTFSFKSNNQDCSIDLSQVDTNKVGIYKYSVKCGKRNYFANIEVKDTIAPKAETKVVNIKTNDNLTAKQFITKIYDLSEVNYEFDSNFTLTDCNAQNGLYLVPLQLTDNYGNKTQISGILLVSNLAANKFLSASKITITDYDATLEVVDKIGFNQADYYINSIRIYNYTFNSINEYSDVKQGYINNQNISGIEGQAIFDDASMNIKLVTLISREELSESNGVFPFTYIEIQQLYKSLDYKVVTEAN